MGFCLPGVALAVAVIHRKDGAGRILGRWVSVFAVTVVGLVAYALLNKQLFEVYLPISGMLKSTFPHVHVVREYVFRYWWAEVAALIALVANAWIVARARALREDGRASESDLALLFTFNTYCILPCSYTLSSRSAGAYNWYFHHASDRHSELCDDRKLGAGTVAVRPPDASMRVTAIVLALLLLVVPARAFMASPVNCHEVAHLLLMLLFGTLSTPPDTVLS